jgi:hypothetical protein
MLKLNTWLIERINNEPKEFEIMGEKSETVESFKYLGSLVTNLNEMEIEI